MHLVAFRIVAPSPPVAPDEARALRVALEQAVDARRGAEHVRVHTSRDGALGVLFVLAPGPVEARAHCLSLCAEALAGEPQLSGWRIVEA
ncbi:hypothetical protein [Streptomyces sp. NPDC002889]|uniref:hypothetical protein n=1 Tax=Streptomyces sp. NPDC002889 TaxID=3364669 RepID=UPI0036AD1AFE